MRGDRDCSSFRGKETLRKIGKVADMGHVTEPPDIIKGSVEVGDRYFCGDPIV